jgi:hypothetical protein
VRRTPAAEVGIDTVHSEGLVGRHARPCQAVPGRGRAAATVGDGLVVTQTIGYGLLCYTFAVFLTRALGRSALLDDRGHGYLHRISVHVDRPGRTDRVVARSSKPSRRTGSEQTSLTLTEFSVDGGYDRWYRSGWPPDPPPEPRRTGASHPSSSRQLGGLLGLAPNPAIGIALLPMWAEVLKGHLDGLLLAAPEAGPWHGYAVMKALRQGSGGTFDLPTGTVYPALHRLERAGLIEGSWSGGAGRERPSY